MKTKLQTISWLALLFFNLVLFFINSRLNTFISPWGLHFYWDGLLIAYPALNMRTRPGLLLMIFTGFVRDALIPVDFGQHMLLYSALFLFIRAIQKRLNIDHRTVIHLIAQLSNLTLILIHSLTFLPPHPHWREYFGQILVMTLISQGALAFITLWIYQLQFCIVHYISARFDNSKTSQLL